MSWLSDKFKEFTAQVNPFDNGRTAATVRRERQRTQPVQTVRRPAQQPSQNQGWSPQRVLRNVTHNPLANVLSRSYDQLNPLDNGRTWKQRTPTKNRSVIDQLTHNGATNFAGNMVKSAVEPAKYFGKTTIVNPLRETAAQLTGNDIALRNATRQSNIDLGLGAKGTDFGGGARKFLGNTAQVGLNLATPAAGRLAARGVESIAPKVVPSLAKRTVANAATGALVGAPSSVAATVADTNAPLTRQNLQNSALQGAAFGAALGGAGTLAVPAARATTRLVAPVVRDAAVGTTRLAKTANERAFTPRINLDEQNALRAMSDYLAGVGGELGPDLSRTIRDARGIAQKYGVDINTGSRAARLNAVNSILDQIGQANRQLRQAGYARVPIGKGPEPTTNILPDAEVNVFAQNPMGPVARPAASSVSDAPRVSPTPPSRNTRLLQEPITSQDTGISIPSSSTVAKNRPLAEYSAELPTELHKRVGKLDKAFRSTRSIIERQGTAGKELADRLQRSRDTYELYLGQLQEAMPTVTKLARKDKNRMRGGGDFENFVEATQGLAKPKNELVQKAIQEWRATHPGIRQRAVDAGLDVGDLGSNYYPHFIDFDRVFKDRNTYNEAINHLVKTGQAPNAEEAIKLLGYARDVSRNREFGNLEASRVIDLPFYDKSPNSLSSYLTGSSKRIAQTETFGKQDEEALKLITKAGREGYDTEAMKNAYDVAVGAKKYNPTVDKALGNIRKYTTTTRLGLGALTNISQSVNTGIVTGHTRTLMAGLKQFSPEVRQFAKDAGVISDALINDMRSQQGYKSFTSKVLGNAVNKITAPGFGAVEKFNRSLAATAGRDYGLRLAQKGDEATLRKLGVTGEIKNGTLTEAQQVQVARKVVEKTQFKVDPQDLPGWADSPGGKLVTQFRTFSYSQGKFFSNEVLKPLAKGNVKPVARVLAALPVGYALYELRRQIDGRPEEENKFKEGLAAFSKIGGAGLAFDIYQSLNPLGSQYIPSDRRVSMAAGALGGPTAGTFTQGVGAVSEAVQRKNTPEDESRLDGKVAAGKTDESYTDLTPLSRFGLQQVPIVGTPIKNRLLPYRKESEADAGKSENKDIASINKGTADKQKAFKASFSKDDYDLYKLNRVEREQAVDAGLVSKEKLDELDDYAKDQKVKLGLAKARAGDNTPDAEYKAFKEEYDDKVKNGEYNAAEKIRADKKLARLEIGSKYTKNTRDLYSLSKTALYDYLTKREEGIDKATIAKRLIEYDKRLYDAGLISYQKFKKGIAPSTKRGGGGKRKRAGYDYKLFGYGQPGTSVNKSLRQLLESLVS